MKTVRDTVTGPTFVSFNGIPIPIDSTPITPAYQAGEKVLDLEIFLSRYLIPAPFYIKLINDLAWWPITPFSPPPACPKVKTPASPPPPPRPPVSTAPDPNFVPNGIIGQNGGNPPPPRSKLHNPTEEELFPGFFPTGNPRRSAVRSEVKFALLIARSMFYRSKFGNDRMRHLMSTNYRRVENHLAVMFCTALPEES